MDGWTVSSRRRRRRRRRRDGVCSCSDGGRSSYSINDNKRH